MNISVNQLYIDNVSRHTYRILFINKDADQIIVIQTDSGAKLPEIISYDELMNHLQCNICTIQTDTMVVQNFDTLTSNQRERLDFIWNIISEFVTDPEQAFSPKARKAFISQAAKEYNLPRSTIQRWLHKYWAGGSTKMTLIPQYKERGGQGIKRLNGDQHIGRPRIYHTSNQTLRITETELQQIESIIKKYYNKDERYSFKLCYEKLIRTFYTDKETGKIATAYPTKAQFRYHAQQFLNQRTRIGEKKFDRTFRPLKGNSMSEAEGPGEKYQIDATIADIYLVSMTDRNMVVGRPVLYFVTDVFSHIIVGFYISLEGPSWLDAMMAVYYTVMDKVELCKRFGIEITEADWPCHGLPQQLMTDNGELVSKASNELVERLGIHMQNASAWRPDMKAIVEQSFHLFNGSTKMILPGGIQPDFSERGGHDYRLDATLNLHEFYQIIIHYILKYNSHSLTNHPQHSDDVIRDSVPPVPLKLWNWGILNRSGSLRVISSQEVAYALLPIDKATVTRKGIKYKNRYYSCESYIKGEWGSKAAMKKSWRIDIKHDPRTTDSILYCKPDGSYEICSRIDTDRWNWFEEDFTIQSEIEKHQFASGKEEDLQRELNFQSEMDKIIENAQKEKEAQSNVTPFVPKGSKIREHRKSEQSLQHESEQFLQRPAAKPPKQTEVKHSTSTSKASNRTRDILKFMEDDDE